MKKIFVLLFLIGPSVWARVCTMEEIQTIDTIRFSEGYSPYPLMTKVNLIASLLPMLPYLDSTSQENTGFQTVTFVGLSGWIYFTLKSLPEETCEDPRQGGGAAYQPKLKEVLDFHYQQKEFFWKSYLWSSAWMLGIVATSNYADRKTAAVAILAVPWMFSFSRTWPALAEDQELQLTVFPRFENNRLVLDPGFVWNF